uniref:F-box domain-containing protein n=1 Tax=Oryza punctata TaxID=4537 RepID=A0A0E0KH43_ORYPU
MPTAQCCEPVVASVDLGGGVPCLCRVAAEPQLIISGLNATHLLTLYAACGGLRPGGARLAAACEGPAPPASIITAPPPPAALRRKPPAREAPPPPPAAEKLSPPPQQHDDSDHNKRVGPLPRGSPPPYAQSVPSVAINEMLPDDVLSEILGRLPPRSLAAARCVCAAWRATINGLRLLRTDLLPLSLAGIFIRFDDLRLPEFFSRPSTPTTPAISGKLDYMPNKYKNYTLEDHCNGLLLLYTHVVNPATRRCVTLPRLLPPRDTGGNNYIVFDPTVSPHYEVIKIPYLKWNMSFDPILRELEWPPSPFLLNVFSSTTKQWEDRLFVREGEAAGTIGDIMKFSRERHAVYWHGALYVHVHNYITRLSLPDGKYKVIKNPQDIDMSKCPKFYVGKSEKGVYLASLEHELDFQLSVWILNESCAKAKWVLKHRNNLKPLLSRWGYHQVNGPWILQDVNYNLYRENFGGQRFFNVTYDDLLLEGNNEPVEDKYE